MPPRTLFSFGFTSSSPAKVEEKKTDVGETLRSEEGGSQQQLSPKSAVELKSGSTTAHTTGPKRALSSFSGAKSVICDDLSSQAVETKPPVNGKDEASRKLETNGKRSASELESSSTAGLSKSSSQGREKRARRSAEEDHRSDTDFSFSSSEDFDEDSDSDFAGSGSDESGDDGADFSADVSSDVAVESSSEESWDEPRRRKPAPKGKTPDKKPSKSLMTPTTVGDLTPSAVVATPEEVRMKLISASPSPLRDAPAVRRKTFTSREQLASSKRENFNAKNEARYRWLTPEHIKDGAGRRPGDPEYDFTSVSIPRIDLAKLSPFEQQFWNIKKAHFDTVLFFKKGKFYELYEHDADIAKEVLGLRITDRVNMRMAGVPESHFIPWAAKLIQFGYKVGRVDQMETASDVKPAGSKRAIVQRELAKIYTQGTLVDESLIRSGDSQRLLGLIQMDRETAHNVSEDDAGSRTCFGVCQVDCSTGSIGLGHICDDRRHTKLETLLLQCPPKELLRLAPSTDGELPSLLSLRPHAMQVVKRLCADVAHTVRDAPWNSESAAAVSDLTGLMASQEYFQMQPGESTPASSGAAAAMDFWGLTQPNRSGSFFSAGDILRFVDQEDDIITARVLHLCLDYLQVLKMDRELVSQQRFSPLIASIEGARSDSVQDLLHLDAHSLANLEIVRNSLDGGLRGTLLKTVDHTRSPFGKRLLVRWVCAPLCNEARIKERLDAVAQLIDDRTLASDLSNLLRNMPDLERLIGRIHAGTVRIAEFLGVIDAFEMLQSFLSRQRTSEWDSALLRRLCSVGPAGHCPDLGGRLKNIVDRFDREQAKSAEKVVPVRGFEKDHDAASDEVERLTGVLSEFLAVKVRGREGLNVRDAAQYKSLQDAAYLIEVKMPAAKQKAFIDGLPSGFHVEKSTKAFVRLIADEIQPTIRALQKNQRAVDDINGQMLHRLFKTFDASADSFMAAISCMAQLDCLLSLADASSCGFGDGRDTCKPEFVEIGEGKSFTQPFLELRQMRHPCLAAERADFVSNDVIIGGGECEDAQPHTLLLTGPNMGGKSTLLRQVCLNVILAQIGCFVAAESCRLSVVDRIFTRLGANDDILAGQSTFMVELDEASNILRHFSDRSLIVLDELGRGTATFDGYSIAYSVLKHLVLRSHARTLFSTHYHRLTQEFSQDETLSALTQLGHMDALVDDVARDVTFLYALVPGVCERSYGMHVASMAGLPESLVLRAEAIAEVSELPDTGLNTQTDDSSSILDVLETREDLVLQDARQIVDLAMAKVPEEGVNFS